MINIFGFNTNTKGLILRALIIMLRHTDHRMAVRMTKNPVFKGLMWVIIIKNMFFTYILRYIVLYSIYNIPSYSCTFFLISCYEH